MIMELRLKGDKTVFLLQFKPYVFKHTNRVKMIYCDIICSYDNNSVLLVVSTGPYELVYCLMLRTLASTRCSKVPLLSHWRHASASPRADTMAGSCTAAAQWAH